jgi:hypothetical protein
MSGAASRGEITHFVRGTLGCTCPDRVFGKIEIGTVAVGGFPGRATRIVVGDTLLIYIVHPESARQLAGHIEELATLGRSDRDTHHYNRYRLVVADAGEGAGHETSAARFSEAAGADEKMHLHFVPPDSVTGW